MAKPSAPILLNYILNQTQGCGGFYMSGFVPFFVNILKSYTQSILFRIAVTFGIITIILIGCKQMGAPEPEPELSNVTGGIYTYHNDFLRTGRNLNETTLNRSNVNASSFGLIGRLPVDGQVYAQPLVANGIITQNGQPAKNLVFVATENDSVYAYDITDPGSLTANTSAPMVPVWQKSFMNDCNSSGGNCSAVDALKRHLMAPKKTKAQKAQITPIQVNAPNISPEIGITATPVIDPNSNTIYVTAMSQENGVMYWKLHALSLATGNERAGSPVVITGTYKGIGLGSSGDVVTFSPINQLSRAGLVLNNGIVTVAFTSFDDNEPDHGWVFSYDAATLGLAGVWMTTPNSGDGTIWQAGGAPAVDSDGSLIFATGNGDPNFAQMNPPDLADSVIKIKMGSPDFTSPDLAYPLLPADFFTPYNHAALATGDVDLGSGGVLLLPTGDNNDIMGTTSNLLVAGGKQGTLYLLNRDNLGGLSTGTTGDNNVVDELIGDIPGGKNYGPGIYGTPSYYNGKIYLVAASDSLRSIPITNGKFNWAGTQAAATQYKLALRGATASISATGPATSDSIIWYIDASAYTYSWVQGQYPPTKTDGSALLYAFSTDDLSKPLYVSPWTQVTSFGQAPEMQNNDNCISVITNAAGCAVKFAVPTVQNGLVFVGTDTEVSVFGLLNQTPAQ